MSLLSELIAMHGYARPAGSQTELQFIDRYIRTLPNATYDDFGNWHVVTNASSRILWSCHTDTVHHHEGRQTTHYDDATGMLSLSKRSKRHGASCLGADDTVGVFLMRQMVLANVPGHYIFHFGEEAGGIGSHALAEKDPEFLRGFDCAIALDRDGYVDVITHQYSQRTASDSFALALGGLLGLSYTANEGVYTDTAEYAEIIPECTNLSVGYFRAHTSAEYVDTRHVLALLARLLVIDVSTLEPLRDPSVPDPDDYHYSAYSWNGPRLAYSSTPTLDSPTPSELASMSRDDLETAVDMAEWSNDYTLMDLYQSEIDTREECTNLSCYLDPDYADIQRALALAQFDLKRRLD